MLSIPHPVRVFLCAQSTDMRKGFNGLSGLVRSFLKQQPTSGHLFVFRNRAGDKLKLLYWDRDGLAIWYKQLEKGTFRFPTTTLSGDGEIDNATLLMILEGIDLNSVKRQKRYRIPREVSNHPIAALSSMP